MNVPAVVFMCAYEMRTSLAMERMNVWREQLLTPPYVYFTAIILNRTRPYEASVEGWLARFQNVSSFLINTTL
jgi:hypothetical protein